MASTEGTFRLGTGSVQVVQSHLPQVRKRRGLSQAALAQIAGVRIGTIQSLEAGTARTLRFETLARLCDVLHCQPGDLFEVPLEDHTFPVLGGADEDEILRARRGSGPLLDGPSVMAELLAPPNQAATTR